MESARTTTQFESILNVQVDQSDSLIIEITAQYSSNNNMIRPPAIHQSSLRDSVRRPLIPDACNLLRPSTDNQSFVQQKIGLSSLRGILQHFRLTRISRPRYHLHDDQRELFC
ncbi:unnamed protein product [Albugo candida]|uniref:Uncharacterized protein n=1 Tax=Albugo candida TaxID=65357 RepID=A0A024GS09_9STRA|nr:unnamed protein product [Albugo candida]|eukprot:CCI49567.1 unnamed protein product [Albugo candida]